MDNKRSISLLKSWSFVHRRRREKKKKERREWVTMAHVGGGGSADDKEDIEMQDLLHRSKSRRTTESHHQRHHCLFVPRLWMIRMNEGVADSWSPTAREISRDWDKCIRDDWLTSLFFVEQGDENASNYDDDVQITEDDEDPSSGSGSSDLLRVRHSEDEWVIINRALFDVWSTHPHAFLFFSLQSRSGSEA